MTYTCLTSGPCDKKEATDLLILAGVGCKPGDIAEVICMAISEFQKDGPAHLQKIKIIIFQTDMLSDFITGMKNSIVGGKNIFEFHIKKK